MIGGQVKPTYIYLKGNKMLSTQENPRINAKASSLQQHTKYIHLVEQHTNYRESRIEKKQNKLFIAFNDIDN